MVQFADNKPSVAAADRRAEEEERYTKAMAPQLGYPYIFLRGYPINPEAIQLVPEQRARELEIVCFDVKQKKISLAAKQPNTPQVQLLLRELEQKNYTVEVFLCSTLSLDHAWTRYKDVVSATAEKKGVFEIDAATIEKLTTSIKTVGDVHTVLQNINTANNSRRISETLETIFAGALALGASDIHIEPEATNVRVRYRFDGVLHDVVEIDSYIYERLLSRLKLLSGMVLNSKQAAQDGRFTFETNHRKIEVRSSVIPGSISESMVMRILDPTVASFSMENLQLNPRIKQAIATELKKPNGLIITTGPTGSGKTTALYAFLQETHKDDVKIITIENPVEYKLEGIVQTQVGENYSFAEGLRAILRQDPDIIMVGEVRDEDVARTAIHAAQTGHLVFTTLHTNSAAAAFARFIDLDIDPRMLGTSINIVLGQRLVRVLCPTCRISYTATPEEVQILRAGLHTHPDAPTVPDTPTLYKASGCEQCGGTGFKGRAAIFEGIIMDEAVEEVVIRDSREHIIMEAAKPQGIPTMLEDGLEKVLSGLTSLTELSRVVALPIIEQVQAADTSDTTTDTEFQKHIV